MKEKILAALKLKYKNFGFKDNAFNGVATFLAGTTTEEDQIETVVSGVEDLLKGFQSDYDTRTKGVITDAGKWKAHEKELQRLAEESGNEDGGDDEPEQQAANNKASNPKPTKKAGDDGPAWAKKLFTGFTELQSKINAIETNKTAETRRQVVEGRLNGTQESFMASKLRDFDLMGASSWEPEKFETYLSSLDEDAKLFKQEESNSQLDAFSGRPFTGSQGGGGQVKPASKEDAAALIKTMTGK